jgi:hypothetical protein
MGLKRKSIDLGFATADVENAVIFLGGVKFCGNELAYHFL